MSEWERCRPFIEAALTYNPGCETIDDIKREIDSGGYQFWPGRNCAAVTEIAQFPQRRLLLVRHGGGDLAELIGEMEPLMCEFAKANGCNGIMGDGRKGWERVCAAHGYKFASITMVKDFTL